MSGYLLEGKRGLSPASPRDGTVPIFPLLELEGVKTYFPVHKGLILQRQVGTVKAVDGVGLRLRQAEILGLVGESGCGKTTLARTITQLVPATAGRILLDGKDLRTLSPRELRKARPGFQMIFQDPYASLNPRMTVFDAIAEPMRVHGTAPAKELPGKVTELMEWVGLAPRFMRKYPHEFSGGQRQRIAIARALALKPKLIIADEPVSALDVSVQAQILNLLARLRREADLAMILISHDLAVVKHVADRIAVMYLGKIVELGDAVQVFEHPLHPYTMALISAIPVPDPDHERTRQRVLLRGDPPSSMNPPPGCAFHPRCPHATEDCARVAPELRRRTEGRQAACIRLDDIH